MIFKSESFEVRIEKNFQISKFLLFQATIYRFHTFVHTIVFKSFFANLFLTKEQSIYIYIYFESINQLIQTLELIFLYF